MPWHCYRWMGGTGGSENTSHTVCFLWERMDLHHHWPSLPWRRVGEKCFLSVQSLIPSFSCMVGIILSSDGLSELTLCSASCFLRLLLLLIQETVGERYAPPQGHLFHLQIHVRQTTGITTLLLHLFLFYSDLMNLRWLESDNMNPTFSIPAPQWPLRT